MTHRCAVGLAVAVTLGITTSARAAPSAEDDFVRITVERVAARVEAGKYNEALEMLDKAESQQPHPVFVYTRATIEELRGDCERAAALYRRFLTYDVAELDAEDARAGEARCTGNLESDADASKGAAPVELEPIEPEPVEPELVEPPRPWFADPPGAGLSLGGVVVLGVGAALTVQSRIDEQASEMATTIDDFDRRGRRAVAFNRTGLALLAVGSTLLVSGVIRYAVVGTRPRRKARAMAGVGPRSATIGVFVSF